jgi:peptidyl-tRNA hydrolase
MDSMEKIAVKAPDSSVVHQLKADGKSVECVGVLVRRTARVQLPVNCSACLTLTLPF